MSYFSPYPACTIYYSDAVLTLVQRRRRWPNVNTTMGKRFVFARIVFTRSLCYNQNEWRSHIPATLSSAYMTHLSPDANQGCQMEYSPLSMSVSMI